MKRKEQRYIYYHSPQEIMIYNASTCIDFFFRRRKIANYLSLRFSKNRAKDALRACGTAVKKKQLLVHVFSTLP